MKKFGILLSVVSGMIAAIGTKAVNAKPMTRQEYNDFRGWQLPENENGADEGYLVEYQDGGEPKETAVQATWQDRVCEEIGELVDRKEKLEKFLSGNKPNFVSDAQWDLMKEQLQAMYSYHNILIERLDEDAGVVSGIRLDEQSKSEGLLAVSAVNPTVDSQEYHQQPTMDFGYAVKMMKEGLRVKRAGWNGKGMFLALVNGSDADYHVNSRIFGTGEDGNSEKQMPILDAIYMKTADNKLVPWLASQTDLLSEDWCIIE